MDISSSRGSLPFLVAGTQRACVLRHRLARKLQASGGVRMLELPVETPELVEAAWWHPSRASDPGHRWLVQMFREAAAAQPAESPIAVYDPEG